MSALTEHRRPTPRYRAESGHAPVTGWTWDGRDRANRIYRAPGSGWHRQAVVERRAGEWRWRVEEWHGHVRREIARGREPALFAEMLFAFADLSARTRL